MLSRAFKPMPPDEVSWKPEVIEVAAPPTSKELKRRWPYFIKQKGFALGSSVDLLRSCAPCKPAFSPPPLLPQLGADVRPYLRTEPQLTSHYPRGYSLPKSLWRTGNRGIR
jgi:hypothetical protein